MRNDLLNDLLLTAVFKCHVSQRWLRGVCSQSRKSHRISKILNKSNERTRNRSQEWTRCLPRGFSRNVGNAAMSGTRARERFEALLLESSQDPAGSNSIIFLIV